MKCRRQLFIRIMSLILIVLWMAIALSGCSFGWFNSAQKAMCYVSISAAPNLYLDIENHGSDVSLWRKTITSNQISEALTDAGAVGIEDQILDPVTTANGITFADKNGNSRVANSRSFIEFKVWFIATTEMWVHLSGQTIQVMASDTTTVCKTSETGAKADITKANRVSFEDSGTAVIWEPNKGSPVAGQTTFDVSPSYSDDTRLFRLNKLEPKQITIRIWLEGEDPECDDDVISSDLSIKMLCAGTDDNNNAIE